MKTKTLNSLVFFMALSFSTLAQNLVPNYSFEQNIKCTTNWSDFNNYIDDWTGQGGEGGLGYFTHQCSGDSAGGGSVPYNLFNGNFYSFQYAHTGVSYVSIVTFGSGSGSDTTYPYGNTVYVNYRNYIQAQLINSLKLGTKYYVTFYVNLVNGSWFSCGDIGAYFSDSALVFNNTGYGKVKSYLTPQVVNNAKKQELTDTLNWIKVSGNFVATGGEKYIIIGNFKTDSMSSIRFLGAFQDDGTPGTEAWYYIDDVIVSPDSAYADSIEAVNELKVESVKCKVYPNPNNGKFSVAINNYELGIRNTIEVYNIMGEKVYAHNINSETTQIDLSNEAKGLYLYRVINMLGEAIASGKLVIQ